MTETVEVDVAVVGAGGFGTMTALRAGRHPGLTVAVFDKDLRDGSNSAISSGSLAAGGTRFQRELGIEDSPEQHAGEILAASGDEEARELVLALCRAAPEYVEWIADALGYPVELGTDMPRAGMSVPRLHTDVGRRGGGRLMAHLRAALAGLPGVAVVDGAPAVGLLTGGAGVTGVVVEQNGARQEVRAGTVVLACDGFGANPELMREHCAALGEPFFGGTSASTGDAVPWLRELGAAFGNMSACLRHGLVVAGHGTRLNPALPFLGAVLVDAGGRRFVDETAYGYSGLAGVLRGVPGERAVLLWDQRAMDAAAESELMRESVRAGAFGRFESPTAVAAALGLPADVLAGSLAEPRPGRPLEGTVLHAAWVTHGVLTTQGGARIDPRGRVLCTDGSTVPGLRAGGGTAVGLAGPDSAGYSSGNGLLAALGMGWIVGSELAARR
ncbi:MULTISPECIES: FAD-dependent oxidoreductase [unclassified Geodermatophilus]|uniref:FAD-dependent oxidoreductase n=1 Tax=unclassified Geodermatophilus TaxID=2637632 RepID=UPI003EEAFE75